MIELARRHLMVGVQTGDSRRDATIEIEMGWWFSSVDESPTPKNVLLTAGRHCRHRPFRPVEKRGMAFFDRCAAGGAHLPGQYASPHELVSIMKAGVNFGRQAFQP